MVVNILRVECDEEYSVIFCIKKNKNLQKYYKYNNKIKNQFIWDTPLKFISEFKTNISEI